MPDRRPAKLSGLTDRVNPERDLLAEGHEPPRHVSITSILDDALESGVSPLGNDDEEIPGEDAVLRAGDPDADALQNELSGDEAAGGSNASPDDNDVDALGRLYGVSEADRSELVLGDELIAPRDRDRWENNPASKDKER